jgi:hypothetical protein
MTREDIRPTWAQLPAYVRDGIERVLSEKVVLADSQPGGFSPGTADRVLLASGRRAFIKAASADTNQFTATLHRDEAAVTAGLPAGVPATPLLGSYDDGTWVALVLGDVEGRHPALPWCADDVASALESLHAMVGIPVPEELLLPRATPWCTAT